MPDVTFCPGTLTIMMSKPYLCVAGKVCTALMHIMVKLANCSVALVAQLSSWIFCTV